jgi:hypothetical protein
MRLVWWLVISVGGAVLITVALFIFPGLLSNWPFPEVVVQVVFWPMFVCEKLSGPGVSLGGSPEMHEGTPVQAVAIMIGIGLSWAFWSSLVFLAVWVFSRRRSASPHSHSQKS